MGECFYVPGDPKQPLLLAGTGTGLAPLWGILHDALASGHSGPIELWHGARVAGGLYLVRELEALASVHRHFTYRRCILEGSANSETAVGSLDAAVLASASSFDGHRIFLCGDPNLVNLMKRKVFLKGASMREIHADAFVPSTVGRNRHLRRSGPYLGTALTRFASRGDEDFADKVLSALRYHFGGHEEKPH